MMHGQKNIKFHSPIATTRRHTLRPSTQRSDVFCVAQSRQCSSPYRTTSKH